MHPNVNFGIKILRNSGKRLAKAFDEATLYAGNHHQEIKNLLDNLVSNLNGSIEYQLSESFSQDKVYFTDSFNGETESENYWLFDAFCSSENLDNHIPFLSMSLTYFEKGVPSHAIVYNPLTDEVFSGSKDLGAQYDQRRMRYTQSRKIKLFFNESREAIPQKLEHTPMRSLGSATLAIMHIATNRGDFSIISTEDFNSYKLSAAKLICRESGLNFFKKENGTTWVCSSSFIDRSTFELLDREV